MAENKADSAAIDIEGLVYHSIKAQMSQDLMSPNCCIFKTPNILSRINGKAYVPDAFSIGPYHHGRPEFKEAEKIKCNYLQGLISRSPSPGEMLKNLTKSVMDMEGEARQCYAEPVEYNPNEFVKILVIDGCFIIELFRKMAYKKQETDRISTMACMHQFLHHDLILLENQVPWRVLECLFNLTKDPTEKMTLIELAKSFLGHFVSKWPSPNPPGPPIQDIRHILDVLRRLLVSSLGEDGQDSHKACTLLPSATSLVEAGVKIIRGESGGILDIEFNNGVLKIPPLDIQETTEALFRNIISFEQCYPNCEPRLTSYAVLLDNLINTRKDVDILRKNKIINNWVNPEDVIPFFNKLYYNAFVKDIYYKSIYSKVNIYYNRRWPRWRAMLVRNYLNTPCAILSTTAAAILLILSFIQTWYAIYKK
ncbi:hypothetical protein ACB098_01G250100 [Castanea mollissima]